MFEIDHVFVCLTGGPEEARPLIDFGLQLTDSRVHAGQGTANRCAFFDNAYLELLWMNEARELHSDEVRKVGLWDRLHWRETGASPFGISLRPAEPIDPENFDLATLPFETRPYHAPYLPPGASIPILTPPDALREPLMFLSLASQAPVSLPRDRRPPLEHLGRRRMLTGITLTNPGRETPSPALTWAAHEGFIDLQRGSTQHLSLEWDDGAAGESRDFAPGIPLGIQW